MRYMKVGCYNTQTDRRTLLDLVFYDACLQISGLDGSGWLGSGWRMMCIDKVYIVGWWPPKSIIINEISLWWRKQGQHMEFYWNLCGYLLSIFYLVTSFSFFHHHVDSFLILSYIKQDQESKIYFLFTLNMISDING